MSQPDIERLRALEKAVELVAKATPGPWMVSDHNEGEMHPLWCVDNEAFHTGGDEDQPLMVSVQYGGKEDAEAIRAAVNFIREHGSALIAELGQEVGAVADGLEFFAVPDDLHPETVNLVSRFAAALAEKLAIAQRKYGWDRHWQSPAWMDQCREQLVEHVAKGDPRDVAAYCAFLWHHGESTDTAKVSAPAGAGEVEELIDDLIQAASGRYDSGVSRVERQRAETEVATIRAALLRKLQQGADGWRPIETAPKDGRRVLAFAGARPFIARHGRTVGWWDDNDLMRDPTHWQPLPDAPASQDQDGGKA